MLAGQRDDRAELTARQAVGVNALAEMRTDAANQNARDEAYTPAAIDMRLAFQSTAQEVTRPAAISSEPIEERSVGEDTGPFAEANPRVRDGADVVAGLGLGMMGGAATLVERLLDGFLDGGPTRPAPANDRGAQPEPAPNPFAGVAAEARRSAERAQEETARDVWWDERRARARDG